jgi:hypothetical protein
MTELFSRAELEGLLEEAVERGAKRVLHDLGVPNNEKDVLDFRRDISEMRSLIAAWRDAKGVIWLAVVKLLTVAVLTAIAVGSGWGLLHDKLK